MNDRQQEARRRLLDAIEEIDGAMSPADWVPVLGWIIADLGAAAQRRMDGRREPEPATPTGDAR